MSSVAEGMELRWSLQPSKGAVAFRRDGPIATTPHLILVLAKRQRNDGLYPWDFGKMI